MIPWFSFGLGGHMACNLSNRESTAESVTTLRSAWQVTGATPTRFFSISTRTSSRTESWGERECENGAEYVTNLNKQNLEVAFHIWIMIT